MRQRGEWVNGLCAYAMGFPIVALQQTTRKCGVTSQLKALPRLLGTTPPRGCTSAPSDGMGGVAKRDGIGCARWIREQGGEAVAV